MSDGVAGIRLAAVSLPREKIPATVHGFRDATTDERQITGWFGRGSGWNLAIAPGIRLPVRRYRRKGA